MLSTWSQEDKKWGTFVEWIFSEVSYLPYLKNDDQSVFYQKFLFRSCLNLYREDHEHGMIDGVYMWENLWFAQDLCKVYTEDNQNYVLRIADENAVWSDWVPVTIEDIFFTYDEILRKNRWWISSLNTRNSVKVSLEDGKVNVSFPTVNSDNASFFVNAILPKHVVDSMDINTYRNYFALAPITNWCAKIVPQVKDVNSLIFDVNSAIIFSVTFV